MEQKNNQKDVLIVRDDLTGEIGVVAGLNRDGTPKTTDAKAANKKDFLHFDRHGDMLENFLKNFYRQCKEPSRFGIYRLAVDNVETVLDVMREFLKEPEKYEDMLASHKVDTSKYENQQENYQSQTQSEQQVQQQQSKAEQNSQEQAQSQETTSKIEQTQMQQENKQEDPKRGYQPIDESKINWKQLEEQYGIKRDDLEKSGDLQKMLNYGKSDLVTISPKFGEDRFDTEARLSLRTDEDGSIKLAPHFIRKEPQLDRPFLDYTFTNEEKNNLKNSGNLGHVAQITDKKTGETKPVFISVDRQTNELIAMNASKVRIPNKIGETTLTDQEKAILKTGKPLPNKEIVLKNGKKFTTTLQVNVEQRGVEFVPRSSNQVKQATTQSYDNNQKKSYNNTSSESSEKKTLFQWKDDNSNIRAPKTFGGVPLTPRQQNDFVQGKAILVQDMKRDGQGKPYTAYIKFNHEQGRPLYSRTNPDISQGQEIAPANESRTQVAVNTHGKTNEATKGLNEPLSQGQVEPKNDEQQKKSKGIRM